MKRWLGGAATICIATVLVCLVAWQVLGGGSTRTAGVKQLTPTQPPTSGSSSASRPAVLRAPTAGKSRNRSASPAVSRKPHLVLIVLDGAKQNYFSAPGLPHLQALARAGTQYSSAWAGILESETPSGHAAIGTGSEPRTDGIASFAWATSDNIPVNLFDPGVIRQGAMEGVLNRAHVPSIASLMHQSDRSAKVVALSGHKYYAADALGGPNADVIMYYSGTSDGRFGPTFIPGHAPIASVLTPKWLVGKTNSLPLGTEDHLAMKLAVRTFIKMHQRVTLINLPEFDWPLGHVYGGDRDPRSVRVLMQQFDRDLGELEAAYRKAGVLDQTTFVITADHGMAPIYYRVSKDTIEKAVQKAGTSIVSDTFHTGAFLWVRDKKKAAAAAAAVAALRNPYIQSVYFKSPASGTYQYLRATAPLRAAGAEAANQYLLHSFNGPNGPDLVVLFRQGAGSEPAGQSKWKGDHGGSDWESQHIPLIFSGYGIRKGFVSRQPARLVDIAPTALAPLGVGASGMEGVVLGDALNSASPAVRKQESSVARTLLPLIASLQAQSRFETKGR